jgi:hypothetical protein
MRIIGLSERLGHTSMVTRVLILALLQGGILLQADTLGYALNGTVNGFFGGYDVSGWLSADFNTSSITLDGPGIPYSYTFSGPLNGPGYTQISQIPAPACIFGPPCPGPGSAGLHVAPVSGSASLFFADTGEDFTGTAPLVSGWVLNGFQGGTSSAPVSLTSSGPVAAVTGSLTDEALQDYYDFQWLSGAFSVTASVQDAPSGASYAFSVGVDGTCTSAGSATLNSADGFIGTIAISNLPAGQYCVGIATSNPTDPPFQISFNTPVTGSSAPSNVPEPSGLVLLSSVVLVMGWRLLARRSRSI